MALVFFDLDGTLTRVDTFILYCMNALLYRPLQVFGLKPLLKACLDFWKGRMQRQKLKEAFLVAFLEGAKRNEVDRWNMIFLRFVMPWVIRREMLEKLRQHQQHGDRVFLVSASPDIYLEPLAKQWKLNGAICTVLEWKDDHLTGRIFGQNCQGEEKARRIQALFNENELEGSFAYGNSDGDQQLLEIATFAFKI
jgi:phosphatidylglycerophosphatase C